MNWTILDCETTPQSRAQLLESLPPFDPSSVKHGNTKDPKKREQQVQEARIVHERDWIENAALDARTCHIKMAGFLSSEGPTVFVHESRGEVFDALEDVNSATVVCVTKESKLIDVAHWKLTDSLKNDGRIITYNGTYNGVGFDLPMLFHRAWILKLPIAIPPGWRQGRYWNAAKFIDIREQWAMGEPFASTGGLDGLLKLLGCETRKKHDSADFAALYERDPVAAVEHCIADLVGTREAAMKMGIITP